MAAGVAPDYGATDCAMACWPSAGQHSTICSASARRSGRPIAQQAAVDTPIRSTIGINLPPSICTRRLDGFCHGRNHLVAVIETSPITKRAADGGARRRPVACVRLWRGGGREWIQLAMGPQPLRLRNHNFGLSHRIMVKRLATSPHDPLGITDSACKNQLVVVSVEYSPFYTYIPIRSTTIGKSRVAIDPIAMHTSCRSNSDIASVTRYGSVHCCSADSSLSQTCTSQLNHCGSLRQSGPRPDPRLLRQAALEALKRSARMDSPHRTGRKQFSGDDRHSIGYPRMSASGESSTTMHRLLHASGSHPIPTPYDPKTNQYNQDLGLIHSTNGNHLESPKEGSSIDHQVTIYLHAQNITMFPTNETWPPKSRFYILRSGSATVSDLVQFTAAQLIRL
ncbi:hypothetical protein F511_16386 [Dorcoceras hygrometricum]|uniref:Uncharacterized protein n=1 Tax=Dorcoceras hygrometricum TaxID=472368 RepID=A0A2Z7B3X0_9LAMI|nr:hypothetical protein F511_16386 [Dorcoceras hygrometricum]